MTGAVVQIRHKQSKCQICKAGMEKRPLCTLGALFHRWDFYGYTPSLLICVLKDALARAILRFIVSHYQEDNAFGRQLANHSLFTTSELLLSHRPCYVDRSSTYTSRVKNRVLSEEGYRYFTSVHRFLMTRRKTRVLHSSKPSYVNLDVSVGTGRNWCRNHKSHQNQ